MLKLLKQTESLSIDYLFWEQPIKFLTVLLGKTKHTETDKKYLQSTHQRIS